MVYTINITRIKNTKMALSHLMMLCLAESFNMKQIITKYSYAFSVVKFSANRIIIR